MSVIRRRFAFALALVLLILITLEAGLWIRTESHRGPFSGEAGNPTIFVPVGEGWSGQCCLAARTDAAEALERSRLRVWVGETEYPKAHTGHDHIRLGEPGAFSHWVNELRLTLPKEIPNDSNALVRIAYPVQIPDRAVSLALIAAAALALAVVLGRALHPAAILATLRRRRRFASALLAVAFAATLALELGVWRRTEVIPGPFASNGTDKMLSVPVARGGLPSPLLGARGDCDDATMRSNLRFSVNGQAYTKPHADQDMLRDGEVGAFSHWDEAVHFALPPGIVNGWGARVTLAYPLRLASPWMTVLLLATLALLWAFCERPWLTPDRVGRVVRWPILATLGLAWGLTALTGIYAVVTAVALARGWALPSTAAIVGSALGRWLAMAEPHGPELVLALAGIGRLAGWVARSRRVGQTADEARILRLLGIVGLPILFAALVFSASAQWGGLWRQGEFSQMNIAGLIPFSDADAYYSEANDVVKDGVFGPVGSRRPLAQTFRSTLVALGGYNYAATVVIQSLFVGLAIFVAARAVARWHGLWAGIAFAAMAYAVGREFSPTTLTEPLGLFWGLFAIPPLIEALRGRSSGHAVLATALLTIALFNRMGSMFTIPALLLWVVSCFGASRGAKLRIAAAAIAALLGIVALNSVTAKIYTGDAEMVGSNFSYTLCGLTIGGHWSDCQQRYKDELSPSEQSDEKAVVRLMYRKAYENFTAHPSVFVERVSDGAVRFARTVPAIVTQGYFPVSQLFQAGLPIVELIAAVGLVHLLRRMPRHEVGFWALFWPSVFVSAGFVYYDDGRRVMIAIYPVASLFFASGLQTAKAPETASVRTLAPRVRTGAFATVTFLLVCLVVPWLVYRFFRPSAYLPSDFAAASGQSRVEGEQFVFGGSRMTGILVVADGEPLRTDVPTMHVSNFVNIIRQSDIEKSQALVTPEPPPVPFGFVEGPDLVPGEPTAYKFIVPASVMTKKGVPAWRFDTTTLPRKPGYSSYWLSVTRAVPLSGRGR